MAVDEYSKRKEKLIQALRTVASMNLNDITCVVCELLRENDELVQQISSLKKEMTEQEATAMEIIRNRDAKISQLESLKSIQDVENRLYKEIKSRLGGNPDE